MSGTDLNRIKTCLARAEQCRAYAERTEHPAAKSAFVEAAEQWEALVLEILQIDQTRRAARQAESLFKMPR